MTISKQLHRAAKLLLVLATFGAGLFATAPTASAQETIEAALEQLRAVQDNSAATQEELQSAVDLISVIVERFPSSDAAVSILLGEPHAGIDFTLFQRRLDGEVVAKQDDPPAEKDPATCLLDALTAKPTVDLQIRLSLNDDGYILGFPDLISPSDPSTEESGVYFQVLAVLETCAPFPQEVSALVTTTMLGDITVASSNPSSPEAEEVETPPRPEKEIVKDVQTELNRIGCSAGTADGIAGSKTRSAFERFINETGLELSVVDLATEAAVEALQQQEGKICKVQVMAQTPASQLSGRWGFRGECPGLFGRVVRNEGRLQLRSAGNNTLRGTVTNQQGITGPATIQFRGRTAVTNIRFGAFTLKGDLRRSTRNMTISGTGARRCKIVLWKN